MGPREFTRGDDRLVGVAQDGHVASMGPREFTRGDVLGDRERHDGVPALQWGRGSSPAETVCLPWHLLGLRSFNGAAGVHPRRLEVRVPGHLTFPGASMGPREFTRGDVVVNGAGVAVAQASMGPREFTRGDVVRDVVAHGASNKLQWGRGSSPAETSRFSVHVSGDFLLQWGRGSSPAETTTLATPLMAAVRFNGAAGVHPRRLVGDGAEPDERALLQWGRGSSPAETRYTEQLRVEMELASMGPREFTRGDSSRGRTSRQR